MIRVVAQHSPSLFAILGLAEEHELPPQMKVEGHDTTYYRAETHDHYVLYKAAISGWERRRTSLIRCRGRNAYIHIQV